MNETKNLQWILKEGQFIRTEQQKIVETIAELEKQIQIYQKQMQELQANLKIKEEKVTQLLLRADQFEPSPERKSVIFLLQQDALVSVLNTKV
jgi:hypothetical protein